MSRSPVGHPLVLHPHHHRVARGLPHRFPLYLPAALHRLHPRAQRPGRRAAQGRTVALHGRTEDGQHGAPLRLSLLHSRCRTDLLF